MEMEGDIDEDLLRKKQVAKTQNLDMSVITGVDGVWQKRISLIACFLQIPCAIQVFSMSFLAPNLDHWCDRPPEAENLSVGEWRTLSMPPYDEQCSRYEHFNITHPLQNKTNMTEQAVIPCETWEYDTTIYSSTILSQFDLVCDRKWLVSLSKSVYIAGMSLSLIVFSYLSDKIGRKPVIIISGLITVFSGVICALTTTFVTFLTARFFIALGVTVFTNIPLVLVTEVVCPKYRHIYAIGVQFGWSIGFLVLPLIAWLIRDSFWIQIATMSPCLILIVLKWLPESPRWLLNHGKKEEAERILLSAAKINGVKLTAEHKKALRAITTKGTEAYESGSCKGNALDLLKIPCLRKITLNVCFTWFVVEFVYYGLSINTNDLAGDPFVNFALSGLAELLSGILVIFFIGSLGRRKLMIASMIVSGAACFSSHFFPADMWWLTITVSMIGKFAISAAFVTIYLFSNELFPTVVRSIGVGAASLCGRFGSLTAPFMRELGDATLPVFPQIIFGVLSLASGLLLILLPETKNSILPDTIQEAAQLSRKKKHALPKEVKGKCIKIKLRESETNNEKDATNLLVLKSVSSAPEKV